MNDLGQNTSCASLPRTMLVLRSLNRGGAETQAITLARALHARGWPVMVVSFYAGGVMAAGLEAAGVPLINLGKRSRWDVIAFLFHLWRVLRRERPDILHGYLPTPNLLALLMRVFFPNIRIVWGVRASKTDLRQYDWFTRLTCWLERRGSRYADLVIANSECGARLRIAQGFPEATMRVIPNGIDTDRFRFNAEDRARVRREWEIQDSATLVGLVGRLDPVKDHQSFLEAAVRLAANDESWYFVCVGDGLVNYKASLIEQAQALELEGRLIWAGTRDDMTAVYSALDIVASSSCSEGFANVVAEAMACGRPCVVTDVGDSALVVGAQGIVVPPGDPLALATGLERMQQNICSNGEALSAACRDRVLSLFSVDRLVQQTEASLWAVYQGHASIRGSVK